MLLLVDGGLVDEHVVVVLAEDHEVVTDWQEVVADRQESSRKKCRRLFFFSLWQDVCVYWLDRVGVAVSAAHCSAPSPRSRLVAHAQSRRVY